MPSQQRGLKMNLYNLGKSLIIRLNLISLSVRLGLPSLTVRFALLLSKSLYTGSKQTVLCLGRPIFDEDVLELSKYGSNINYIIIQKVVFISIYNYYFPKTPLSRHIDYYTTKEFSNEKYMYRQFIRMFLRELLKVIQVDAILTANYVYAWQQELAVICDEMNIPVVILFKEGISPLYSGIDNRQNAYDLLVKYYTNNRFLGSKLLVYNENIRDAFIRANIEGLNKNAVETVGIPRFDRYFRLKKNGKDIVFFSFSIEDKARHLGLDKEVLCDYLEKQEKFHIEVMKYAKSYPDKNVIIKTKSNTKYLNYTKKIAIENGCSKLNNLVITNKGNVYDYIKNSYAVIGYNSTVLLEALAAGRLIINPDFREGIVCDFFEEYPNLANYAKNMEDIHNVISSIVVDTVNNDDLKSLLYDRIYVPDGQACLRTEICIKNSIMYSKQ